MATHKQAWKRHIQSEKRRLRNRKFKSTVATVIKKLRSAVDEREQGALPSLLTVALKAVGKAKAHGAMHKNKASRLASRLTKAVNKAS